MSLCDVIALLIGLFGGFYSIATSTKEGLEYFFPLDVSKVDGKVQKIQKQHKRLNGEAKEEDRFEHGCKWTGKKLKLWLKLSQGALLLPSMIFLASMIVCAYQACVHYDAIKETVAPQMLPEVTKKLAAIQSALENGSPPSPSLELAMKQVDQDIRTATSPLSPLKDLFIGSVEGFGVFMLLGLVFAWVFRWFAQMNWKTLERDLKLVPKDIDEYSDLASTQSTNHRGSASGG